MAITLAQPRQLPTLQPDLDRFNPLPRAPYQYVPILQDRSGERNALANVTMDSWRRLTPLIMVVGPRDQRPATPAMLADRAKNVFGVVGLHPFFVDILRLRSLAGAGQGGASPVVEYLYGRLRSRGALFIPVIPLVGTKSHRRVVNEAAYTDGRGAAVRIDLSKGVVPGSIDLAAALRDLADDLAVPCSDLDVIIDVGFLPPDKVIDGDWIVSQVSLVAEIEQWRSLVLCGTSMPQTLGMINEGSIGAFPRHEWALWEQAVKRLGPIVSFGDYGIQHPTPPADAGPGMRASIRYTMPNRTVVVRGEGPVTTGLGSLQYQGLALQLVGLPDFATRDYSWGDEIIERCADGGLPTSSQHTWRGAGTSHHIEQVCDQLDAKEGS